MIAMGYAFLAVLLAWVLFDHHSPGGYQIFTTGISDVWRMVYGVMIVAGVVLNVFIFINLTKIARVIYRLILSLTHRVGFHSKPTRWVSGILILLTFAGAFAGAFALAVAFAVAFAFAGAFTFALAFALAFAFAGAGVVAVAVVNVEFAVFYGLFFLLLPFINAMTDFISVGITRRFLTQAGGTPREKTWETILSAVADLLIGALCLVALLWLLTQSLDLWARISPNTVPIDWQGYWEQARMDWRNGFALWCLAFTTLLPTAIHLFFAIEAMVAHGARMKLGVLRQIAEREADGTTV